jgi:putative PIN family toxin of toxin-antitoxin system
VPLVVVDASSLIRAALTSQSPARVLVDAVLDRGLLVASREILDEVDTVLRRPKFTRWLSPGRRQDFVRRIAVAARLVEPTMRIKECRDPTDDKYLEAVFAAAEEAADGTALLVTDDRDLLVLEPWREAIRILKPEAALAALLQQ